MFQSVSHWPVKATEPERHNLLLSTSFFRTNRGSLPLSTQRLALLTAIAACHLVLLLRLLQGFAAPPGNNPMGSEDVAPIALIAIANDKTANEVAAEAAVIEVPPPMPMNEAAPVEWARVTITEAVLEPVQPPPAPTKAVAPATSRSRGTAFDPYAGASPLSNRSRVASSDTPPATEARDCGPSDTASGPSLRKGDTQNSNQQRKIDCAEPEKLKRTS